MVFPKKKNVHRTVCRIDRKTKAVTAGVNFEDIDLTIEGEGSEVYDYEYMLVVHNQMSTSSNIYVRVNDLTSYDWSLMNGVANGSALADVSTNSYADLLLSRLSGYPSISKGKITGYIGNKRHVDCLNSISSQTLQQVRKSSTYTTDTSTELTSFQLFSVSSETITYTLVITAVPKIQYNPNAVLLKHIKLINQTADIIFGGVNDTEGVDDLDGDVYDYYVMSSGLIGTESFNIYLNDSLLSNKNRQLLYNSNGSLVSQYSAGINNDGAVTGTGQSCITSDTGKKKITTTSSSRTTATQQVETYVSNSDTSTKLTSILLRVSVGSPSGNVQLYAVPKGYNADLTPWTYRQVVNIAGDFSAGKSFEIPSDALFMKVDFVGDNNGFVSLIANFNDTTQTHSNQYLKSLGSATSASSATGQADMRVARIDDESKSEFIMSLKSGANRPSMFKAVQDADEIRFYGQWLEDSSTVLTSVQIKASNSNSISGLLTVSFY